jgi:hypothetical protein
MKSLQTQFIESRGKPILLRERLVCQMDIIPITTGVLTIEFIKISSRIRQGVAIKVDKGAIAVSEEKNAKLIHVWHGDDLPLVVEHSVESRGSFVKIWNIYNINGSNLAQGDCWTNNAGMVVEVLGVSHRRYYCSDGIGEFNPTDMIFEIKWLDDK